MRLTTFSAAAIVLFTAGLALLWPGHNAAPGPAVVHAQPAAEKQPQEKSVSAPRLSADLVIEEKLNQPTDLDVVEMPLKDVLQYLHELHHVPIVLKAKKMEEAGVSLDVPITKSLKGIRLRSALNLILEDCDLTFVVRDEVLQITTPGDAQATMGIRIYDCRDILAMPEAGAASAAAPAPSDAEPEGTPRGYGGTFGGHVSERDKRASQLISIITTNVDPSTWQQELGGSGSVSEYNGLIVVTQTAQVHTKIEHVLDMLREAAGLEPSKARKVVR
jgi:hypothetical protein